MITRPEDQNLLKNNGEARKNIALELYQRYAASKTYGKDPEALESIISTYITDLGDYPVQYVIEAVKIHARNSQEYPTISDIVGIIRRRGRKPIPKEVYISKQKIAPEDRSQKDWETIATYENQQDDESESLVFSDHVSVVERQNENSNLRKKIIDLKEENARAWGRVRELEFIIKNLQKNNGGF